MQYLARELSTDRQISIAYVCGAGISQMQTNTGLTLPHSKDDWVANHGHLVDSAVAVVVTVVDLVLRLEVQPDCCYTGREQSTFGKTLYRECRGESRLESCREEQTGVPCKLIKAVRRNTQNMMPTGSRKSRLSSCTWHRQPHRTL